MQLKDIKYIKMLDYIFEIKSIKERITCKNCLFNELGIACPNYHFLIDEQHKINFDCKALRSLKFIQITEQKEILKAKIYGIKKAKLVNTLLSTDLTSKLKQRIAKVGIKNE